MNFSERTDWNLAENELTAAIRERRASGHELFDLTLSNPTHCGFDYDAAALLAPLHNPQALDYEPTHSACWSLEMLLRAITVMRGQAFRSTASASPQAPARPTAFSFASFAIQATRFLSPTPAIRSSTTSRASTTCSFASIRCSTIPTPTLASGPRLVDRSACIAGVHYRQNASDHRRPSQQPDRKLCFAAGARRARNALRRERLGPHRRRSLSRLRPLHAPTKLRHRRIFLPHLRPERHQQSLRPAADEGLLDRSLRPISPRTRGDAANRNHRRYLPLDERPGAARSTRLASRPPQHPATDSQTNPREPGPARQPSAGNVDPKARIAGRLDGSPPRPPYDRRQGISSRPLLIAESLVQPGDFYGLGDARAVVSLLTPPVTWAAGLQLLPTE